VTPNGDLVPNLVPPRPDLVPPSSRTRLATPLATSSPRPLPYGGRGTGSRGSKAPRITPTSSPIMEASQATTQPALPPGTPSAARPRAGGTPRETGMPTWLRRQFEETGVVTQGFTRAARVTRCKKCQTRIIKGWTDEPCAVLAACDPTPLSNLSEMVAILDGRMTFDLARRGGRYELDLRESDHIEGSPPETPNSWRRNADVLAEHRCHAAPLPSIESRIP
jgi:hypothetical protein